MKNKQYGILNPNILDYLMATVMLTVSIAALWIGIWITATDTITISNSVYGFLKRAFEFKIYGDYSLLVALQSTLVYFGIIITLTFCAITCARKKYRAIAGIFGLIFSIFALAILIGYWYVFLTVNVSGVFVVILSLPIIALVVEAYLIIQKLVKCLILNFCKSCDKKENEKSEEKLAIEMQEKVEEADTNSDEDDDQSKATKGFPVINAHNYTFEQKLKKAKPIARRYFRELRDYFESLGFKATLTKSGEIFTYKNTKYAVINTAGQKGLKVYFKLDANDYIDSTIPVKDLRVVKKHEKTPLLLVVKSDLAVKRAKSLMDDVKEKLATDEK